LHARPLMSDDASAAESQCSRIAVTCEPKEAIGAERD
jgi:hypothetical protein